MVFADKFPALDLNLPKIIIPKRFTIEKHPYSIIKIIPYKSGYTANDFEKIMNTLSNYNKSVFDRFEFRKNEKTLVYHPKQSMCYEILFTREKVIYCYAIEKIFKNVFMNKLKFLLDKCDIVEIDDYLGEFDKSLKYRFHYKKNSMFSINTDDKINVIDSLLLLTKDLGKNDKVLLQYSMNPLTGDKWKGKWQNNFNKYSQTGMLENEINPVTLLDNATDILLGKIDSFIDGLVMCLGGSPLFEDSKNKENYAKELSNDTKHKSVYDGFKCNLNMYVKSDNPIIVDNLVRNTNTILHDLSGDNCFRSGKRGRVVKFATREVKSGFISNTKECVQLIKTPSEKMMKEYDDILDKINVAEMEVHNELFSGHGILLGDMMKGSTYRQMTFGTHANSISKPLIYISPQEGGKSTFLRTYGVSALEQGHSIFAFDTIDGKNIQVIRDHLPKSFPEEKIIVLDFRSNTHAFLLMWNEISETYNKRLEDAEDEIERYQILEEFGSAIGSELLRFIDTFQDEDRQNRLSPAMRSTLSDLAQLVFMNNGTIGTIKDCLYDINLRHKLLDNLKISKKLPFAKSILKLDEETLYASTIHGIETRLNLIMNNPTLKKYFSLKTDKKLDFSHWANNGYCVLIQVPEELSDVLVTFLVQKLWLAVTSSRYSIPEENRPHTHLLIDEPNKFPTIMNLLNDHLIASRKWHLRFIFCIHNMNVFRGSSENIKAAGTSIIMLPTSQFNFSQVSEFFQPLDYSALKEVERLTAKSDGKIWYALCSIHYRNVNYPCVIKLPLPVDKRYKTIDRSYLNEMCANMYGVNQRDYYLSLFENDEYDVCDSDIDLEECIL